MLIDKRRPRIGQTDGRTEGRRAVGSSVRRARDSRAGRQGGPTGFDKDFIEACSGDRTHVAYMRHETDSLLLLCKFIKNACPHQSNFAVNMSAWISTAFPCSILRDHPVGGKRREGRIDGRLTLAYLVIGKCFRLFLHLSLTD